MIYKSVILFFQILKPTDISKYYQIKLKVMHFLRRVYLLVYNVLTFNVYDRFYFKIYLKSSSIMIEITLVPISSNQKYHKNIFFYKDCYTWNCICTFKLTCQERYLHYAIVKVLTKKSIAKTSWTIVN